MKRNRRNPKRERKRRRWENGDVTKREHRDTFRGKNRQTSKRANVIGPVEQERRRRLGKDHELPAELRKAADEMGAVLPGEEA